MITHRRAHKQNTTMDTERTRVGRVGANANGRPWPGWLEDPRPSRHRFARGVLSRCGSAPYGWTRREHSRGVLSPPPSLLLAEGASPRKKVGGRQLRKGEGEALTLRAPTPDTRGKAGGGASRTPEAGERLAPQKQRPYSRSSSSNPCSSTSRKSASQSSVSAPAMPCASRIASERHWRK